MYAVALGAAARDGHLQRIVRQLTTVPGVGQATLVGGRQRQIDVTIDAKGNYTVNREAVSFRDVAGLADALQAAAKAANGGKAPAQTPVVVVNADQFAMHQMVIHVMEAARLAGYEKLTFAAQAGGK